MSFINPIFLYFLPLVALPVLIHLIGRQRYYRQEFSTLRFLKQLEVDLIRKLKIRQWLLLILRMLLILALIFIFARPYRTTESPGLVVSKGTVLYLVADNSLSMQGRYQGQTLLGKSVSGILSAVKQIDFPVYVKLVETTRPGKISDFEMVSDPAKIAEILHSIPQSSRHGNINRALNTIQKDINSLNELNPAVWIFSDFQKEDFNPKLLTNDMGGRMIFFPVIGRPENVSISALTVPVQLFRANQPVTMRGFFTNWNSDALDLPVSLFLDEQKLGQALVNVNLGTEASVEFEFVSPASGSYQGRLKIADDDLILDNQRYFSINIPDQIRALIVARENEDGQSLKRALDADASALISSKIISVNQFPVEDLSDFNLLIFSNIDELPRNTFTKLDFYLETGHRILVLPGRECQPERFNELWADRYGFPKWRTPRTAEGNQFLKLGNIDSAHPIFRGLLKDKNDFNYSPEFYTIPGFSTTKNHTVIASFEDNTPLIIESKLKSGIGILFASAPVSGWSNLQWTGFFPAVMNRLVIYLSQGDAVKAEIECGDTIRIIPARLDVQSDLSIKTPDNRRIKLPFDTAKPVIYDDTDIPGFYELYSEGNPVKQYAVNVPESETKAEFVGMDEFKDIIRKNPGKVDVYLFDQDNELKPMTQNREFSDWLIAAVLIIALLETVLGKINSGRGRKEQHG